MPTVNKEDDIDWVSLTLYRKYFPQKKGSVPRSYYERVEEQDKKRRNANSKKSLYKWCEWQIAKAKLKRFFSKIAMIPIYPVFCIGQLLIYASKLIKAIGFVLVFDLDSAKYELSDWEIEF